MTPKLYVHTTVTLALYSYTAARLFMLATVIKNYSTALSQAACRTYKDCAALPPEEPERHFQLNGGRGAVIRSG